MDDQPNKQKGYPSLNAFWHYSILSCLFVLMACSSQTNVHLKKKTVKATNLSDSVGQEIFSPPKTIPITLANLPKVVKSGKPVIRIDSTNGGALFFTNYGTEQGLPLSGIFCSMEDKLGNLWFGTNGGGVSKYDGKSFTNYTMNQGLIRNGLQCIMEDRLGNLWFGTDEGVSKYNGRFFEKFTKANGLPDDNVRSIMQDKSGEIWFGTHRAGACRFDGKKFTYYNTSNGLASNNIWIILQDSSGNIWFGTCGGGVSRFDGKTFFNYTKNQGLAGNDVRSIIQDRAGNIWFGTNGGGVCKYDGKSFSTYTKAQGLADNSIWSIMQDRSGDIWFGSFGAGVSRYDGKLFTNYTSAQGLAANVIQSILQDRSGAIWFGTLGGGISRCEGKGLRNYSALQGLPDNPVFPIIQDKSGIFWMGTQGGGVNSLNGRTFKNYTTLQGLANNQVWCIMQEHSGHLWFGTRGGASRFDGKTFTNYTTAQGLVSSDVRAIMQDKSGNIWFGTYGGGASKYDGKRFTNYGPKQGLASNEIMTIAQDKSGNLWFGSEGGGVSKFDGNSFTTFTRVQGLAGNTILSIIQDKAGSIWFGTTGGDGASRYDGKSFRTYSISEGLADNYVYSICEDTIRHIVWFGTNQGLSGLRIDSLGSNKGSDGMFEIFNNNTGYPIKDLNTNSLIVDNRGILWAACGDNKLIKFDYDAMNRNPSPLTLQIINVKVNEKDMVWNNLSPRNNNGAPADSLALQNEMVTTLGKMFPTSVLDSMRKKNSDIRFDSIARFYPIPVNLVLPYMDNSLTLDFTAIEPDKPKQVKYQYSLEGYSKGWSQPSNSTTAEFGNLNEGSYTFKLKALSPYGVWSQTEYKFKVLPPWQRTWWAYSIFIFLLIGITYLIYKIRLKLILDKLKFEKQISEVEMRALRSQMNPHFIFNSLNSIHCFIQSDNSAQASEYLIRFSKLMRLILENSLHPEVPLEIDLEALRLYMELESVRLHHKFTFEINTGCELDIQNTMIPPLLLQPFVENAIWHGMANKESSGKILVSVNRENDTISCVVEDNGIGREKAAQLKTTQPKRTRESLGLKLTRDRIDIINRTKNSKASIILTDLYDESKNSIGTRVVVRLPLELAF